MGAPSTDKVRNVVLVGHGGAGKTTLAEAMLFMAGETSRLGSVDDGHSSLDYDSEEQKRTMTVNLSLAPLTHKGVKVNIIDTPGYADFVGDAIAGMEAAEMALFVVDAVSGPQVQTDRLWKIAGDMGIARAVFINRLDKEHADFEGALDKLVDDYGHRVGAVQIPIGKEHDLEGVVDIIRMKAYIHGDGTSVTESDIPEELLAAADEWREKLLELVAEADDDLMEKYLEGERLSQQELETLLDKAIAQGIFIPVFVGSATQLVGIRDLLDEIVSFFPEPTAHGPLPTADGGELPVTVEGATAGFVFKTLSDPYLGRLNFVKVVSGTLAAGSELINSRTGKKERLAHIYRMLGKEMTDIEAAPAGDIAVAPKLSDTLTNDTLSESGDVVFAPLPLPEPLYPVAIVAKTKADEDKLGVALKGIVEEDPSLHMRRDEETHQTVLSAMGDTAIDVVLSRLHERFHVEAETEELRIPYRETIRKTATAQGRHKKQTGGAGQFGDCWLRLEPNPGGGYEFVDEIVGGRIPRQFIPAVDKGVQDTMTHGVLAGYPVVDVRVAVYDGSYHSVDSNEMAFKTAARIGFKAAAEKADMVLLEPIATLDITVPDEYAGAIMGDISSIRGRILGMDAPEPGVQVIKAQAPYAEVVHYSTHLRSITSGTGSYTISIDSYEQVPGDIAKKIVEQYEKERAEGH
ncbi:MAG: elongation factor G [Anaerosomatales bacterium]|nr:elongation factor G [Anaerosomatales bacterium]